MKLLSLHAHHFRNLKPLDLPIYSQFNVFFGNNAQGKTNILEAIYFLATLRSFRTHRAGEMIELGEPAAFIQAKVQHEQVTHTGSVEIHREKNSKKIAKLNGKLASSSQYFSLMNVVFFGPEDLQLVIGPKSLRRRFLDRAIFNLYPSYLEEVRIYERLLQQRNASLRSRAPMNVLEVYNEQFCQAAARIIKRRQDYLHQLEPYTQDIFTRIGTEGKELSLHYELHGWEIELHLSADEIAQLLHEQIIKNTQVDLYRGHTTIGPHTDDLLCSLDGQTFGMYTSQGQNRTLVLSIKIAEIMLAQKIRGTPPLFLLDDVSSELDSERNEQLFRLLQELPTQSFITTTRKDHIRLMQNRQDFLVQEGRVEPCVT